MRAVQITEFGGPEVLRPAEVDPPVPSGDQVLIDVDAAGVNFADTHQSQDTYLTPQQLPLIPGSEVVGTARGGEFDGRRVVALTLGGGYAEQALADPRAVFPLPDDIADEIALALVLQGTTAWHLLRTCARLGKQESVVVQAAAGGVGSIAVQLARQWGAGRVIATASSDEKRELAGKLGADVSVDITTATTTQAVRDLLVEANDGDEVDVVLDMTGGHVSDGSLAALAPWGRLVVYGMASRAPATPIAPVTLMTKSLSVVGFWLVQALRLPDGLVQPMEELGSLVRTGRLRPVTGGSFPLEEASRAHEELLARRSVGKLVLTVR